MRGVSRSSKGRHSTHPWDTTTQSSLPSPTVPSAPAPGARNCLPHHWCCQTSIVQLREQKKPSQSTKHQALLCFSSLLKHILPASLDPLPPPSFPTRCPLSSLLHCSPPFPRHPTSFALLLYPFSSPHQAPSASDVLIWSGAHVTPLRPSREALGTLQDGALCFLQYTVISLCKHNSSGPLLSLQNTHLIYI